MFWLYAVVGVWLLYMPAPRTEALLVAPGLYELGIALLWFSVIGGLSAALFLLILGQWMFAALSYLFRIFGTAGYFIFYHLARYSVILGVVSSLVAMSSTVSLIVLGALVGPLATWWPSDVMIAALYVGLALNVINVTLFLRERHT